MEDRTVKIQNMKKELYFLKVSWCYIRPLGRKSQCERDCEEDILTIPNTLSQTFTLSYSISDETFFLLFSQYLGESALHSPPVPLTMLHRSPVMARRLQVVCQVSSVISVDEQESADDESGEWAKCRGSIVCQQIDDSLVDVLKSAVVVFQDSLLRVHQLEDFHLQQVKGGIRTQYNYSHTHGV